MSKVTVQADVHVCDGCGAQTYVHACLKCGVEHCWDCQKKLGREYTHGVNVGGTGDGYYCYGCDSELTRTGRDPIHNAYVAIRQVRDDSRAAYERFTRLGDAAEAELKRLQGAQP